MQIPPDRNGPAGKEKQTSGTMWVVPLRRPRREQEVTVAWSYLVCRYRSRASCFSALARLSSGWRSISLGRSPISVWSWRFVPPRKLTQCFPVQSCASVVEAMPVAPRAPTSIQSRRGNLGCWRRPSALCLFAPATDIHAYSGERLLGVASSRRRAPRALHQAAKSFPVRHRALPVLRSSVEANQYDLRVRAHANWRTPSARSAGCIHQQIPQAL